MNKFLKRQSPSFEVPLQTSVDPANLYHPRINEDSKFARLAHTFIIPDNTDGVEIEVAYPSLIRADIPVTPGAADVAASLFYGEAQGSNSPTSTNLSRFNTRYAYLWKAGKWKLYNLTGSALDFACTLFEDFPAEAYQAILAELNYGRLVTSVDIVLPAGIAPVQLVGQSEMASVVAVSIGNVTSTAGTNIRIAFGNAAGPTNGLPLWATMGPLIKIPTSLCTVSANTGGGGIKNMSLVKYYG